MINVGYSRLFVAVRPPATLPHTVTFTPTWFLASAAEIVSAKAGIRKHASNTIPSDRRVLILTSTMDPNAKYDTPKQGAFTARRLMLMSQINDQHSILGLQPDLSKWTDGSAAR